MKNHIADRVGEVNNSDNFGAMEIVEYRNSQSLKVRFLTGSIIKTTYNHFRDGNVKDPLFPSICGVGYIGFGKHKPNINKKRTKSYIAWKSMIQRCYNPYCINKGPTYKNATVCEEWYNYQVFAEWYENNYYEVPGEKMELDKDLVVRGNRIYNPYMCNFVPKPVNLLFKGYGRYSGACPPGVCLNKKLQKYLAQITIDGKTKYLGLFDDPEEAFRVYKAAKENNVEKTANKYAYYLPQSVYNYLIKYRVNMRDNPMYKNNPHCRLEIRSYFLETENGEMRVK